MTDRRARVREIIRGTRPRRTEASLPPRAIPPADEGDAPITNLLWSRLAPGDAERIEAALSPSELDGLEAAGTADRRRLTLAYGLHHAVDGIGERTGLSPVAPPDEVHAMGRGARAVGGSPYYADLVAEATAAVGAPLSAATRALDFGCSSGRVVRVLAAAIPGADWSGCDPLPSAIEWAAAELPGIDFEVSPTTPPLAYPPEHFDLIFAISIWSHFGEGAALRWLGEMARLIEPGGNLLMTVQGWNSIAHYGRTGLFEPGLVDAVVDRLASGGPFFYDSFGQGGDHGIEDPEWGMAFWPLEWLAFHATPEWQVALFQPGRAEANQDVIVLRRAASGAGS